MKHSSEHGHELDLAQEKALERLLSDLVLDPVADQGFTDQLMARVPVKRRAAHSVPMAALVVGAGLTTWLLSDTAWFGAAMQGVQHGHVGVAGFGVLAVATLLGTCAALWALTEQGEGQ